MHKAELVESIPFFLVEIRSGLLLQLGLGRLFGKRLGC
jgi:hypothetical protein